VEAFAAYKDAFTTLKEILKGVAIVEPSRMQGDKMAKITTHLEVPFEFGNVYVNKNIPEQIVNDFFSVCNSFPSGKHDDDPDALAVLVSELTNGGGNIYEGVL
jgi:predicted phage terminase large subunit-like protein